MQANVFVCVRPECAEHAMQCMARLVRAIFGFSAVAARKLDFGPSLVALGILITPSVAGYSCSLAKDKAQNAYRRSLTRWRLMSYIQVLHASLQGGLAGRLSLSFAGLGELC